MKRECKFLLPVATILAGALVGCGGGTEELTLVHGIYAHYEEQKTLRGATGAIGKGTQVDVNYVAAIIDKADKIVDFKLDVVQLSVFADNATSVSIKGKTHPDTDDTRSKWELLYEYGMEQFGPPGNLGEWFVQAGKIETYAVGKKVNEVFANLTETGEFPEALVDQTGVSITVDAFGEALKLGLADEYQKSTFVANKSKVKLGIGINSHLYSAEAANAYLSAVVFEGDVIKAARNDEIQPAFKIETVEDKFNVVIKTERAPQTVVADHRIKSKVELREAYGMSVYQPGAKELYVNVDNLAKYTVGKKIADVFAGIDEEEGKWSEAVQTESGVSITVSEFHKTYLEAYQVASNLRPVATVK